MDELIQRLIKEENRDELISVLQRSRHEKLQPKTLGMLFEIFAHPINGYSTPVSVDDLVQINQFFKTENGCAWARSDNSWLGKKYIIERALKNGRVSEISLKGFNESNKRNREIPADIRQALKDERCCISDVGENLEIDHKNGRYQVRSPTVDDFQVLHKSLNDAKRQHCKICLSTGKRYDARRLGFSIGYLQGDENSTFCNGCYWYDPQEFYRRAHYDF